ncbi:hypothetical protein GOP47_0021367 [Adiantum capillus-veneris]|uniref:Bms1-type G domain-containing protein n=1 Tax=Adiantum capillus-veneris TaxID=13818 RepID=A0A9D4U800_ADICA|nr:hypothetical protein GOP47_0021367 [Adiantum capillus-veneris]
MGNARAQKNKPHKSRFSSKSSRNLHKENTEKRPLIGPKRSHHVPIAQKARAARLNHSKNLRDKKRADLLNERRTGTDSSVPPLILALITLSSRTNTNKAKAMFLDQINKPEESRNIMEMESMNSKGASVATYLSRRHKLRLTVIEANHGDLESCLTAAKVADAIAFVTAASSEKDQLVDKDGKLCLSMLRAQGLPSVFGLIQDLVNVPVKRRSDVKKVSSSVLEAEMPEGSKVFFADGAEDYEQVLRYLSTHRLLNPQWRSNRPYLMAQKLEFIPDIQRPEQGILLVSGYVRGRGLTVNQLVHLTGLGDYQLKQVDVLEDPCSLRQDHKGPKDEAMELEKASTICPDPTLQEQLILENIPDPLAGEQTWPTEEELSKADEEKQSRLKKRLLPKGTSEYQAAWIVDEVSDHEDFHEGNPDEKMEGMDFSIHGRDEEGVISEERHSKHEDVSSDEDASISDDNDDDDQSEMMIEEELTEESRQAELERLKAAHAADAEFPDEVDTPLDVPARQRFAKYRGLKSLRTSAWDPKESLPQQYGKIFSFESFQRTRKSVFAKAAGVDEGLFNGSVPLGAYARLHVKDLSAISALKLLSTYTQMPLIVCGLLQHESKMSVLHFSIRKHESYLEPLRSKDSMVFHVGFRIFRTRPIFSTDDINMDKHKLERFLHPGRFSVASIFAPICFLPLPLVVFKETGIGERLTLAASGSLKSVDPDRIVLKKIVLSGYPQRVQKQRAVIRFMFHNPEDVRWFKPLELSTKYGRRGRIKEPVGTHGAMKCVFDGVLQQRDAVCVSLYKRVYPKWPELAS